jgi:hypothetical protein
LGAAKGKNNAGMPSSNATRGDVINNNRGVTEEEMMAKAIV